MPHSQRAAEPAPQPTPSVALTTRMGTFTFSARDRLWVMGRKAAQTRLATELRPGDLVAFLGRVLAVGAVEGVAAKGGRTKDNSLAA